METDWAENRAKMPAGFLRDAFGKILDQVYSTSERDKFRTRLERTPDGKGTEIYISHRGMIEVYTTPRGPSGENAQTVWTPREPDPGLEAEFLRRLMVRLGAQQERAKEMVAAPPPAQRAEIRKGIDGAELLQVNEPFDRAWRRVGLALDRVGFTVEDRDRQKGLYFVRYADPESEMAIKDRERGFFGKLFGGESQAQGRAVPRAGAAGRRQQPGAGPQQGRRRREDPDHAAHPHAAARAAQVSPALRFPRQRQRRQLPGRRSRRHARAGRLRPQPARHREAPGAPRPRARRPRRHPDHPRARRPRRLRLRLRRRASRADLPDLRHPGRASGRRQGARRGQENQS